MNTELLNVGCAMLVAHLHQIFEQQAGMQNADLHNAGFQCRKRSCTMQHAECGMCNRPQAQCGCAPMHIKAMQQNKRHNTECRDPVS